MNSNKHTMTQPKEKDTDRLIVLLSQLNTMEFQSVTTLAENTGVSCRMIYNYFAILNKQGFDVEKRGTKYRLDRNSPFLQQVHATIPLTAQEAEFVCRLVSTFVDDNDMAQTIRRKLSRYYELTEHGTIKKDKAEERNLRRLNEAMTKKLMVILKNYSSPNSHTTKDRLVEPFYLFNSNQDIRCHEVSTHINKTFKVARIESVELLKDHWQHEKQHKRLYTDIFAFSGENAYMIELILGQLSRNLLVEEYPQTARLVRENGDGRWRVILNVMSYLGIGRFVLGLYDDIEVVGDEGFKQYLREKIEGYAKATPSPEDAKTTK